MSLFSQKEELEKLNELERLKNQNNNSVLSTTIEETIKEKQNLSDILQSSVKELLSSANQHLEQAHPDNSKTQDALSTSAKIIHEVTNQVKDLSNSILSSSLTNFGLYTATEDLCNNLNSPTLQFKLTRNTHIPRFNYNFEVKLYYILEKNYQNLNHITPGTVVTTNFSLDLNLLHISFTDTANGQSFNGSKEQKMSITQASVRVQQLDGSLHQQKTSIHIEVRVVNR